MRNDYDDAWLPRPLLLLKWIFLGVGVAGLWLALNYEGLKEYFEARARRNEVRQTVEAMDRQYSQLLQEKHELEQWGFTAERAIRERLKMIRPGERVLMIDTPANESDFTGTVTLPEFDQPWTGDVAPGPGAPDPLPDESALP